MGQSLLIFGLGITGQAALAHCLQHSIPVIGYDDQPKPKLLETTNAPLYFKTLPEPLISTLSGVIFSPGISPEHPLLKQLQSHHIPIVSDIDYFAQRCQGKIIGITGSNGKSTVTALTTHLLKSMGFTAISCGNFGYPVMKLLDEQPYDYYVVELSSYQLEWTQALHAQVGCFTNLSPNHLDRYTTLHNYQLAKERLFTQCEQLVIHTSIQPLTPLPKKVFSFCEALESRADFHITQRGAQLALFHQEELLWTFPPHQSLGAHHLANMLAALAIIHSLGLSPQTAATHLKSYPGLPHRLQRLPSQDGFIWINDSKSTTTAATIAALKTVSTEHFKSPLILLLGGIFKEYDLSNLVSALKQASIKHLIVYGRDQSLFVQAFQNEWPVYQTLTLEEGVQFAKSIAQKNDCILLSPCCASLDQFPNFEARGAHFQACMEQV